MKLLVIIFLNLVLLGFRADAATYAVKAGGGGDFTNVQSCANAAVAGDTCTVFAGTYSGWTQPTSGSAGKPITFIKNVGDTVTITGTVELTNRKYITIDGFKFSLAAGPAVRAWDTGFGGATGVSSDLTVRNNVVVLTSISSRNAAFYLYGDRTLLDNNEASGGGGDFSNLGGTNVVARNNYFHDYNGSVSGEHSDGFQEIGGGTIPVLTQALIEGNRERNCTNDGGNCHFVIIRTGGPAADTVIVRFNYAQNLDGSGASFGGVGDNVPHSAFYNNTMAAFTGSGSANCASYQNAPAGIAFNNICYNVGTAGSFQIGGCNSSGLTGVCNGNIVFDTGYTGGWDSVYGGEATYNILKNLNPAFANYPTDATLQSGSPARNAGVPLARVASSDSGTGTSLVLTNGTACAACAFQPGWAGTQADWIRIGGLNTVQIASINYSTNTLTLAGSVTRSVGDPVYLYKRSDGTQVLFSGNPDIGAYPAGGGGGGTQAPAAPTGLTAVVS